MPGSEGLGGTSLIKFPESSSPGALLNEKFNLWLGLDSLKYTDTLIHGRRVAGV